MWCVFCCVFVGLLMCLLDDFVVLSCACLVDRVFVRVCGCVLTCVLD